MRVGVYFHPIGSFEPCTGIGRHVNNIVMRLAERPGYEVELLFSEQWLEGGRLPSRSPLHSLPFRVIPGKERAFETRSKLLDTPVLDGLCRGLDCVYSPVHAYLSLKTIPFYTTFHDVQAFERDLPWSRSWQHRLFRWKWSTWVPKALKRSRAILTVSEFSRQQMISLLQADPARIHVVGNGINDDFLTQGDDGLKGPQTVASSLTTDSSEKYAIIIGGLKEKKGAQYVFDVADELARRSSGIRIRVVGSSEAAFSQQAAATTQITEHGVLPDSEMLELLRGASALLFLSPYEGFGIPAIEAMACGVPVIAANSASLPEIVGEAGLLVDVRQTAHVTDSLVSVVENQSLRGDLIQKGLRRCREFSWQACVDRVCHVLSTTSRAA